MEVGVGPMRVDGSGTGWAERIQRRDLRRHRTQRPEFGDGDSTGGFPGGHPLETQCVTTPSGRRIGFVAPATLRGMLLAGVDEIGLTLAAREDIDRYRAADRARRPWAYTTPKGPVPR